MRRTASTTTSSRPEEFDRRVDARRVPRARRLQRQPVRDPALRGRPADRRRATRWCSRSRSRAPSRSGKRCPKRSRSSSRRPSPSSLRDAARPAAAPIRREAIDGRLEVAEQRTRGPGRVPPPGHQRRSGACRGGARGHSARRAELSVDSAANDQAPRRPPSRAHRLSLRRCRRCRARARQINSYYQSLNEGGYGDYPPPMVPADPAGSLTLALEEVAEGKIKYEYRS